MQGKGQRLEFHVKAVSAVALEGCLAAHFLKAEARDTVVILAAFNAREAESPLFVRQRDERIVEHYRSRFDSIPLCVGYNAGQLTNRLRHHACAKNERKQENTNNLLTPTHPTLHTLLRYKNLNCSDLRF